MRSWMKNGSVAALIAAAFWLVMCAPDRDDGFGTAANAIGATETGGEPPIIPNPLPLDASIGGSANVPAGVAY